MLKEEIPLYVDMQIGDFAQFMFKENINNAIIELSLEGIENNKDFFFFLVDLLCKGLVLLYGKDNRIELHLLTLDDFKNIKDKMILAGIQVNLNVEPNNDMLLPSINLNHIESMSSNLDLNKFKFKIIGSELIYEVSFNLIHKV